METLQEYEYTFEYVQGKYNVVADALSRMSNSATPELYTGEDEDGETKVVSVNVMGTVSRPMLTRTMVRDLVREYESENSACRGAGGSENTDKGMQDIQKTDKGLQVTEKTDKDLQDIENTDNGLQGIEKTDDGLQYRIDSNGVRKLVVPQGKLRQALMHDAHDAIVAGHLGFNKAYERLRQGFTWPDMHMELKHYVRSCDSCQK
jgi:hypothetical protein